MGLRTPTTLRRMPYLRRPTDVPLPPPRDFVRRGAWPRGVSWGAPKGVDLHPEVAEAARELGKLVSEFIAMRGTKPSRRHLADHTWLSASTIQALERGETWPETPTLVAMAAALDRRIVYTLEYIGEDAGS